MSKSYKFIRNTTFIILSLVLSYWLAPTIARVLSHALGRSGDHANQNSLIPVYKSGGSSWDAYAGGGCSSGCFCAGTLVAVARRGGRIVTKAIEKVKTGELVLSVLPGGLRPRLISRRVQEVFRHKTEKRLMVDITTKRGVIITATANHPFIVDRSNRFLQTRDLAKGQNFLTNIDGRVVWDTVAQTRKYMAASPVYNLELDDEPHNFLVGNSESQFALVHNKAHIP